MTASVSPLFYTAEQLRAARAQILLRGHDTIEKWAEAHGFTGTLVKGVLSGKRRCVRGQSAAIAERLGLAANDRGAEDQAPAEGCVNGRGA